MPRTLPALAALLLLLPLHGLAADPPSGTGSPSLDLGCALARAVEFESVCRELAFFRHEDARRMGEELAQLLDAVARPRAQKLLDAELAEKGRKPVAGQACPPARPLCAFPDAALLALKEGLGADGK